MNSRETQYAHRAVVVLLFLFSFVLSLHLPGHEADMNCWRNWAGYIGSNGLHNAYYSGTNYLPFYQYILWIYARCMGSTEAIYAHIGYLKAVTLFFDFLGLWLVYQWINRSWPFFLLLTINVLNIAFSYNSLIWGQVDGIMTTLVFAAFYFLNRKQLVWSACLLVLACNMKLQAAIFLPLWGLLFIQALLELRTIRPLLISFGVIVLLQAVILYPFYKDGNTMPMIVKVIRESVDQYPRVSMNAYNFWYLTGMPDPWNTSDQSVWIGGWSYKTWGLLFFFSTSALALFPVLENLRNQWKYQTPAFNPSMTWLTASLIAMLFFYFNTQMHERYVHPAFLFLIAFSFQQKKWSLYVLFSLIYFLQLENVLRSLQTGHFDRGLFHPRLIAGGFSLLIMITYYQLLMLRKKQNSCVETR